MTRNSDVLAVKTPSTTTYTRAYILTAHPEAWEVPSTSIDQDYPDEHGYLDSAKGKCCPCPTAHRL